MPVYEYECEKCGTRTEALRRMADADAEQACSRCGSTKTARVHSVFGVGGATPAGASSPSGGGHVHSGSCGCGRPHGSCGMG